MNEALTTSVRQQILQKLYSYRKAVDRIGTELLSQVLQPDAEIYPAFSGNRQALRDQLWAAHSSFDCQSHQVTNLLVQVDENAVAAASDLRRT